MKIILRADDVQAILNVCRTDSYKIIKEIKEEYAYSGLLTGSKIRAEDLADCYNLKIDVIWSLLAKNENTIL